MQSFGHLPGVLSVGGVARQSVQHKVGLRQLCMTEARFGIEMIKKIVDCNHKFSIEKKPT